MSYDPSAYRPDPSSPDPFRPPPLDYPDVSATAARQRVQTPALFLMIVGGLNLLVTLYFVVNGFYTALTPAERLAESQATMARILGAKEEIEKKTPAELKSQGILVSAVGAGLTFVCALLSILGGWRMYALRSYGLSVVGAVAAAVPCLSGSACCGLGEGVGLWALIVLLKPEVRDAFR
jgi:hypothetical protein